MFVWNIHTLVGKYLLVLICLKKEDRRKVVKKRMTDQKRTSGTKGPGWLQAEPMNWPCKFIQSWTQRALNCGSCDEQYNTFTEKSNTKKRQHDQGDCVSTDPSRQMAGRSGSQSGCNKAAKTKDGSNTPTQRVACLLKDVLCTCHTSYAHPAGKNLPVAR